MRIRIASALVAGFVALCGAQYAAAADDKGTPPASELRLAFAAVKVADLERSLAFYQKLGLTEKFRVDGGNGVVEVLLGFGDLGQEAGLMLMHDPKRTKPYDLGDGYSRVIFYVPSVKDTAATLAAAGATITVQPRPIPALNIVILLARDPDGYLMEFVERGAPQ